MRWRCSSIVQCRCSCACSAAEGRAADSALFYPVYARPVTLLLRMVDFPDPYLIVQCMFHDTASAGAAHPSLIPTDSCGRMGPCMRRQLPKQAAVRARRLCVGRVCGDAARRGGGADAAQLHHRAHAHVHPAAVAGARAPALCRLRRPGALMRSPSRAPSSSEALLTRLA